MITKTVQKRELTLVDYLPKVFWWLQGIKRIHSEKHKRFHYCEIHHELLMKNVWNRVKESENKDDDHVAPHSNIIILVLMHLQYDSIQDP